MQHSLYLSKGIHFLGEKFFPFLYFLFFPLCSFSLFVFISPFHIVNFPEMTINLGCLFLTIIIKEEAKETLESLYAHMSAINWETSLQGDGA